MVAGPSEEKVDAVNLERTVRAIFKIFFEIGVFNFAVISIYFV